MAIFSNKIIEASFTNKDQNQIEILYKEDDKLYPYNIQVDHNHPDFQDLIKEYPLEKIQKTTSEKKSKHWDDIKLAYKTDLKNYKIKLKEEYQTKFKYKWQDLLKHIESDDQDELFKFKLELFEKDIVKNGPKDIQDKIRNAKTFVEVFQEFKKLCSM